MKQLFSTIAAVAVMAMATNSYAAVIADYDFAGLALTSSDSQANSVADALEDYSTQNGGASNPATNRNILGSVSASVGNPSPGIDGTFQTFGGGSSPVGTIAEAISEDVYIEFTITPDSGFEIDYSTVTVDVQKEAGGAFFYSWLLVDGDSNGWDTGDELAGDSFDTIGSYVTMSMDASSLADITTATTFRLYLGSDGTGAANGINVDNIVVNGTVVPEPASLALVGLGALLIAGRRRQA